eukprot:TRINITY_DN607_c2_g1_i1.p2 TRINITY_DN607_c2_g1~~TRINITY_DN607_c2_g1_i1.p2  ORF type:complete len:100 (+),score=30.83 TRINITY_DN607_c2_g1_i1:841-1140(+)
MGTGVLVPVGSVDSAQIPQEGVSSEMTVNFFPQREYYKVVHVGPYSGLKDKWEEFVEMVKQTDDFEGCPISFDCFVSGPETVPEEDMITELYWGKPGTN